MLLSAAPQRILAYSDPVDLRNWFDGLIGLVQKVLEKDPLSETLVVLLNWRGDYLKLMTWDRTGSCRFAKRLEQGRFRLPEGDRTHALDEPAAAPSLKEVAALLAEHDRRTGRCGDLERQVEWFKTQPFGSKSARWIVGAERRQLWLGDWGEPSFDSEGVTVGGAYPPTPRHERGRRQRAALR